MKNSTFTVVLLLGLVLFMACGKEEQEGETPNPPAPAFEAFIGDFQIQGQHINGLHTYYDSIGNIIGMGFDTVALTSMTISIAQQDQTDTLLVNPLVKSFNQDHGAEVQAAYKNDTLNIVHDFSNIGFNDYIRGKIWMRSDSIYLEYRWDRSDVWSTGALPITGTIYAKGPVNP